MSDAWGKLYDFRSRSPGRDMTEVQIVALSFFIKKCGDVLPHWMYIEREYRHAQRRAALIDEILADIEKNPPPQ